MNAEVRMDIATETVLKHLSEVCGAHRAYLFHLRGESMSNTHEWVKEGVDPFLDKLSTMKTSDLPFFVSQLRLKRPVACSAGDLVGKEEAAKELEEMTQEKVERLVLVPVNASGLKDSAAVGGFIGVDFCDGEKMTEEKKDELIATLSDFGAFLFKLQALYELGSGVSPVRTERAGAGKVASASDFAQKKVSSKLLQEIRELHISLFRRFAGHCMAAVPPPVASVHDNNRDESTSLPAATASDQLLTPLQLEAREHFLKHRYAELQPEVFYTEGHQEEEFEDLRQMMVRNLHAMEPDIEPYTKFRNVGYARYRYRNGCIYPLKHKGFFQVDPEVNVLLNSKCRPFSRLTTELREHATLCNMLQVLLERVWDGDLGQDVHINVHPVRVRNFHEGVVQAEAHATLEGTHTDSTMRVAVVMLERHNVKEGTAKTSLYDKSAPMGYRRDIPEHEEVLKPLRVTEVLLSRPFHTITFEDPCFKHDASDPVPEDPEKEMWRCVLLIMCRIPCQQASPEDGHPIDGYTPRSPPLQPASSP